MNVLTRKILMDEKDPHKLRYAAAFRLVLELSQQQLQTRHFVKLDLADGFMPTCKSQEESLWSFSC